MSDKNNEQSVTATESQENHAQKDAYTVLELPGEKLATRRRELNLTLEQVAQTLKLSTRQIAAIEINDFILPKSARVPVRKSIFFILKH